MAFLSQFSGKTRSFDGHSIVVYVDEGWGSPSESEIDAQTKSALLASGWSDSKPLYFIAFCWRSDGKPYVDLWKFSSNPVDDLSGPLADMGVFCEGNKIETMGVASGNTLVVLGLEDLQRRSQPTIESYLKSRPKLPEGLIR